MSKPNNPRAFPNKGSLNGNNGMTLRDWFAGQALAKSLAWVIEEHSHDHAEIAAGLSYQVADAMLAEKERRDAQ